MDQEFVEKITRLVLSKLEKFSDLPPLSDEEIERWNTISATLQGAMETTNSQAMPLSQDEIKRWEEITVHFKETNQPRKEMNQVVFHRYHFS